MRENKEKDLSDIIPEKDFREAISACRKDPELNRYFRFAPAAARRFIGLGFYSTHFGDRADKRKYAEYLARIEPTLSEDDLKYLIRFEPDKSTRGYLKRLLTRLREPPEPEKEESPKEKPKPVAEKPSEPRPRKRMSRPRLPMTAALPEVGDRPITFVLMVIGGLLVLVLLCLVFKLQRDLTGTERRLKTLQDEVRELRDELRLQIRELPRSAPTAPEIRPPAAPKASPEPEPELPVGVTPAPVRPESAAETAISEPAAVPASKPEPKPAAKRRVVLTDGTRIVRRPDGTIEVPREFSYSGAGLKKPFWPYDADLERSGKIEQEAERERKARAEWQALRDEAEDIRGASGT